MQKNKRVIYILLLLPIYSCTDDNNLDRYEAGLSKDSLAIVAKNLQAGLTFTYDDECDDRNGEFIHQETLLKYGVYRPYNFDRSFLNDTIHYAFDIIDDCCINFIGDIEIANDTLYLNYHRFKLPCDCYCNYRLNYYFKMNGRYWKTITPRKMEFK